MDITEILQWRLINQQLAGTKFKKCQEIVSYMGAMQAQDFAMARWAIGLRVPGLQDADVEKAFNQGKILRTHVLRPTWHFVMPADIRWMLELTRPHIIRLMAYNDRRMGLNNKIITKANDVLSRALQGGKQLTRDELKLVLQQEKIAVNDLRFTNIMAHAELEAIVCSGARKGKQFTYALLDERAPNARTMNRDEALAELTKRYFTSRGPATLPDFAWWSGLSMTNVRRGIDIVSRHFKKKIINGNEYFFKTPSIREIPDQTVHLLPNYDEYTLAYRHRDILIDDKHFSLVKNRGDAIFANAILINGKVHGTWRRLIKNSSLMVETRPFGVFNKAKQQAVKKAVKRYSEFVGKSLE
jgi:DNA glycosylase AlkZ-like